MNWELPESLSVGENIYPIRWGYRPVLDIYAGLADPELTDQDRGELVLDILYPDFWNMPEEDYQEALDKALWFLSCGNSGKDIPAPRLVDWEMDFPLIVAPVNRVLGMEIRRSSGEMDMGIHWWTFCSAYQEIGDCTFAQVVRIRDHLSRRKRLDKSDMEWYRKNRDLVDFKRKYTSEDDALLKELSGV